MGRLGGVAGELEEEGVEGAAERGAGEDATVYVFCLPSIHSHVLLQHAHTGVWDLPNPCLGSLSDRLTRLIPRLKLKLYRTLGIDVEADPTTGAYNKAVIRNAAKGDVHVVNIDPKFSRHFYTNYFWRTM